MLALALFGTFFVIALAGVPLLFALLATTVGIIWSMGMSHPLETIFLTFIGGVEPFILLAVPLFIFAGELLARGGVGRRIVDFARVLFGWMPGGLGVVTVVSCMLFGGVSGSAIADTAAIGSLIIPAMIQRGYSRGLPLRFSRLPARSRSSCRCRFRSWYTPLFRASPCAPYQWQAWCPRSPRRSR